MSGASFSWTLAVPTSTATPVGGNGAVLYCIVEYRDVSADRTRTGKMQFLHGAQSATTLKREPNFGDTPVATTIVVGATSSVTRAGAGFSPCGTSPAGIGRLAVSSAPPTWSKAPRAVFIDQTTRDVVLDDTGCELEMSPTDQRVYLLLNTRLGSRKVDKTMGFLPPKRKTPNLAHEVHDLVKRALLPAIEDHSIELLSVSTYVK